MKFFKNSYSEDYFNTFADLLKFNQTKEKINLIRYLKPKGRLLEIGCGNGDLLAELQNYYDASGVDISEFVVSRLKKRLKKTKLSAMNFEFESPKGLYDIVGSVEIL